MIHLWDKLERWLEFELHHHEDEKFRRLAEYYAERQLMDGAVIQKTGEVIARGEWVNE